MPRRRFRGDTVLEGDGLADGAGDAGEGEGGIGRRGGTAGVVGLRVEGLRGGVAGHFHAELAHFAQPAELAVAALGAGLGGRGWEGGGGAHWAG